MRDAEAGGKDDLVGIGDAPVLLLGSPARKLSKWNPSAGGLRQMIHGYVDKQNKRGFDITKNLKVKPSTFTLTPQILSMVDCQSLRSLCGTTGRSGYHQNEVLEAGTCFKGPA